MQRDRIVVSGRAGLLGGHPCEQLFDCGASVLTLDEYRSCAAASNQSLTRPGLGVLHVPPVDGGLHFTSPISPVDYPSRPIGVDRSRPWRPTVFWQPKGTLWEKELLELLWNRDATQGVVREEEKAK